VEAQTDRVDGLATLTSVVRAAGGVVWRGGPPRASEVEVLLVHRPRYDDWPLPKGKLRRGEHPVVGACREVDEETRVRARVGGRLQSVSYPPVAAGGPALKVVDYWAMTVLERLDFSPGHEI